MKRKIVALGIAAITLLGSVSAYAYNYKFSFDMNTGMFNAAAYSSAAYKYTTSQKPVLKVASVESKVRVKFVVVNSDGDARTDTYTTASSGTHVFNPFGMAINKQYRLKAATDDGNWYSRYNVTGSWNPDSY